MLTIKVNADQSYATYYWMKALAVGREIPTLNNA